MASFNKVILIGNLVADPELKQTPQGVPVVSIRIAVQRKFIKQGEQPQSDFFDVVCWRQLAEFVAKFFSKGKPILVCGQLRQRSWVDPTGNKRYTVDVVADEATFVERKIVGDSYGPPSAASQYAEGGAGSGGGGGSYRQPELPAFSTPLDDSSFEDLSADDDLPF